MLIILRLYINIEYKRSLYWGTGTPSLLLNMKTVCTLIWRPGPDTRQLSLGIKGSFALILNTNVLYISGRDTTLSLNIMTVCTLILNTNGPSIEGQCGIPSRTVKTKNPSLRCVLRCRCFYPCWFFIQERYKLSFFFFFFFPLSIFFSSPFFFSFPPPIYS